MFIFNLMDTVKLPVSQRFEVRVVLNHSVNDMYTRFLFKIDALPQYVVLPIEIAATFLKNLSSDVRELFISEGAKPPPKAAK